jgi:hypothetical protein
MPFFNSAWQGYALWAAAFAITLSPFSGAAQTQIFSADFDTNSTALWKVNYGAGSNIVNFSFDYSQAGVPSAPHSTGGTTRGLILQPNMEGGSFPAGLSVSPTNFTLFGDFDIRFDLWLNYPKSLSGSTIVAGAGFGTAGSSPQIAGLTVDSVFFATTTDGGSGIDYRAYTPATPTGIVAFDSPGVYAADSQNNSAAYYTDNFPSRPVPPAQAALFPGQSGLASEPGALAFAWRDVLIHKVGNSVTWQIDGILIATLDMAHANVTDFRTLGGHEILFTCFDVNATASTNSDAFDVLFALIDNVRVFQIGTGVVTGNDSFTLPQNGQLKLLVSTVFTNDVASSSSVNTNLTLVSLSSTSTAGGTVILTPAGTTLWTNDYAGAGGSDYDQPNAIRVDSSGNVFVTGYSVGQGTSFDFATIKYSSAGVPLWTNRYNGLGNGDDQAVALTLDKSNHVAVTGFSFNNNYDYITIKYSDSGVPLWTNRYNGPGSGFNLDKATAISCDKNDGSFFVTGYSAGNGTDTDFATIKYSNAGAPVWTNRYNGTGNLSDEAHAINFNEGVFVTGTTWSGSSFSFDYATIKYSANGLPVWTNLYNGPGNFSDQTVAVVTDASGNAFITGTSYGANADFATISYAGNGSPQWTQRYNGLGNSAEQATAMCIDGSGNILMTGYSTGSGTGHDFATLKYSNDGFVHWSRRFDGSASSGDSPAAIIADGKDNVIVSGYTTAAGGGIDFATIKYSPGSLPIWTNFFNGTGNSTDQATALAVDDNNDVLITGFTTSSGTGVDYLTLKVAGEHSFTYTPPTDFVGVDTFTYLVRDSAGLMAMGTVTIAVGETGIALHSVERQGTEFVARYVGSPGATYTMEYVNDLVSPLNWQKATNIIAPTTNQGFGIGVFEFRTIPNESQQFFRARFPAY